jgi:CBS domain-containing protein
MDADIEFLMTVAPFSELNRHAVAAVLQHCARRPFDHHETLGEFSPPGQDGLFIIQAGQVALSRVGGDLLETRGRGELFGHCIAFEADAADLQAGYVATADGPGSALFLSATALNDIAQQHAVVRHFLSHRPGDRLRGMAQRDTGTLMDLSLRAPVTASPSLSIQACAALMAKHQVSSLPIVDGEQLVGIVTDRDLRSRVLAAGLTPDEAVTQVMTAAPKSVHRDARIDDALLVMLEAGIHHLPVMDSNHQLAGVVSAGDLLRSQAPHPLRLVRDIQRAGSAAEVARLSLQAPGVLAALCHQGSEVVEVGRIASMLTDAATRRLLQLAEAELGPAPMAWSWLAFGSQARMEQGLITDQDNGLLLAAPPDATQSEYFLQLATRVCDGLNDCGYVYCSGDVMAMKRWRMPLSEWTRVFDQWMREPEPQSVMNCAIFFDQRCVAGDAELAKRLQQHVLKQAKDSRIFLRFLAAESMQHTPPLGLFRRFLQEEREGEGKGINLKKRGVLPIVDLARVRALEGGLTEVHTEDRIRAAANADIMNADDADDLIHALRFIGNIRLKHQVRCHEQDQAPNHLVDPDTLSGLHQRYLRSAFGIVRQAHKALALRYQL